MAGYCCTATCSRKTTPKCRQTSLLYTSLQHLHSHFRSNIRVRIERSGLSLVDPLNFAKPALRATFFVTPVRPCDGQ